MATFDEVVKKHYKSEEERIRKIQEHSTFITEFAFQTNTLRTELQNIRKITLWIFDLDENTDPPTMYLGAQKCCSDANISIVTDDDRRYIESEIAKLTRFKNIIWEL